MANELCGHLEARSMLECTHQIVRTHDLLVLVYVATLWDVLVHVLDYDWVRRADIEAILFCALP